MIYIYIYIYIYDISRLRVKARIKKANGIFVELHTLWRNQEHSDAY